MDFWDKISDLYDAAEAINSSVYNEMTATVERMVPEGAKVLDCAAGTGELSFAAAKNAESVVCTDLSRNMLKTAQRKARALGVDNITFAERNIFDLQDPDGTYDVVIAGNVLHLLTNPQGAVKEMYRVLKPGGRLAVITFHSLEDRMVKRQFAQWCQGCICPPDFPQCVCGRTPEAKLVSRKPIAPSAEEVEQNSRSRSAKLRVLERSR